MTSLDQLDATDDSGEGGSCSVTSVGASTASFPAYLLIPAFILVARLRWRIYR